MIDIDDTDLGIFAVVVIAILGTITACFLAEKTDLEVVEIAAIMAFFGTAFATVGALVRGRKAMKITNGERNEKITTPVPNDASGNPSGTANDS